MATVLRDEEVTLFKGVDFNYIKRKIQENEDATQTDVIKSTYNAQGQLIHQKQLALSTRLAKYLAKTRTDDAIEGLNACLSFLLTLFFALDTYFVGTPLVIEYAEDVILILHTLDYLLFFFISDNRLYYIFSFQSICSYLTIIPTFLVRVNIVTDPARQELLLLFRVFRFFSILRLDNVFARRSMTLVRVWFRLLYIFVATVIIFSALMLTVENSNIREVNRMREENPDLDEDSAYKVVPSTQYTFHDMLYFLIITITTVGYGDIYPHTTVGQMLSIGVIFVILSLIPKQLSEFSKVNSLISVYARKSYSNKGGKGSAMHILLLGDAPIEAIKIFLLECFHADHGIQETNLVIMRNNPPSDEMNAVLLSSSYESRVSYIQGNPLYPKDLHRCLAERAKCCVILSNQFCSNPILEDQRNILNALSVKKYAKAHADREIRLCLQLVKPENKALYFCALEQNNKVDQILCSEELKLQLLAKSSICPGIITIIWSLITSNPTNSSSEKYDSPDDELRAINEIMKMQRQQKIQQEEAKQNKANGGGSGNQYNSKAKYHDQNLNGYFDSNGVWKDTWQVNYESGTNYELYRIPLKQEKFQGLRFKDVCMILFHKLGLVLIALEVKIFNQIKVFVNPYDYLFESKDYFGYVIFHENPESDQINNIDISQKSAENFCIMEYITKQEQTLNKKEYFKMQKNLAKAMMEEKNITKADNTYYDNYFTTKKPMSLSAARIKTTLDKSIEGHIIVCGIVSGIKNLILPLRTKSLGSQMRPIVILSNDIMGDEDGNGDTFIWGEINRFEEIYILKGSALNPADLERARIQKAKAIIIVAKGGDNGNNKMQDADAIFMYKTIEAKFKNLIIVTELASMNAIAFLVPGNEDRYQKLGYFMSKPFASGEIYVSSLLDSLMCQAYYSPKITEILEQLILGSANTSDKITKILTQLNLSQSSLHLVPIPKKCKVLTFDNVFETCMKHYNMIVIAVYKRHEQDETPQVPKQSDMLNNNQEQNMQREEQQRSSKKPYVWIHPPQELELSVHDELFVLSDQNPKDIMNGMNANAKMRTNLDLLGGGGGGGQNNKLFKNEDKKIQRDSMNKLFQLNGLLQDLLFSTKELSENVELASEYIKDDLALKIKSDLQMVDI